MKKVPDPAGKKSTDPDPHPCFILGIGKLSLIVESTLHLVNYYC